MRYHEFIQRVEDLGFMSFLRNDAGVPTLSKETTREQWHVSGEDDPWTWRERAPAEKKLAFGCFLGNSKCFIAPRMLPTFCLAQRPALSIDERWHRGEISQTLYKIYGMFEEGRPLSTADLRTACGASKKNNERGKSGISRVDSATVQLQREFHITISGSTQKRAADGHLYGWSINQYQRINDWALEEWDLPEGPGSDEEREEAFETIVSMGVKMGADRAALIKLLRK